MHLFGAAGRPPTLPVLTSFMRVVVVLSLSALPLLSRPAEACGCFAGPPVASTPVVQAGERIFFAVKNGRVIAHIQIQYAGDAQDFGWLLPLPSVPVLKAGSEELFTQLEATTAPRFALGQGATGNCNRGFFLGCGSPRAQSSARPPDGSPQTPLVFTDSVGPYDAAVLKADDKQQLIDWLSANRFVVPTTSDAALGPYLRPGAYFLALKLKAGKTSGDLTPIVVEYASELPMIPITLTSIGATPNMGVQVFLAGNGRAVPRNYRHVVINDGLVNWLGGAQNYSELVTRAVAEAPGKHAFVTDFADSAEVMRGALVPEGRFGAESVLAARSDPASFVQHLWDKRFDLEPPPRDPNDFITPEVPRPNRFPPVLEGLLFEAFPVPPVIAQRGRLNPQEWLRQVPIYLSPEYRRQAPEDFVGYEPPPFDPVALSRRIFREYVDVMRETDDLFWTFPTLTRLYTTLSPEDMNRDPVFGFNPSLPAVPRDRQATRLFNCDTNETRIVTPQGWRLPLSDAPTNVPAALTIETLAEEGAPTVEQDNADAIDQVLESNRQSMNGGCAAVVDPVLVGLVMVLARWRRRSARA
ncbi:MAG: DUF2330 domain-containing protein [Myxococcaceae bacterium]|nr:DUF2330 domain-containing protein [Myxococcaceae bacterium]